MKELTAEFKDRKSEYEIKEEYKAELAIKKEAILDIQKEYVELYSDLKEALKSSIN